MIDGGQTITYRGGGVYWLCWRTVRTVASGTQHLLRGFKETDRSGAERFAKRHDVAFDFEEEDQ